LDFGRRVIVREQGQFLAGKTEYSSEKRRRLILFLQNLSPKMKETLDRIKEDGRRDMKRPDFIWHLLLQSFSTMGNSRGWQGLIGNQSNYRRVTFDALSGLSEDDRLRRLTTVLHDAKVRMPNMKARQLNENYKMILTMGGLERAKEKAFAQVGTKAKIAFMKHFYGIGDKYARNVWMDVYHPDFYDSIAIDDRIKQITEAMGCRFASYDEHERFFLGIAREANIQGWELDRLLYNFKDDFLRILKRCLMFRVLDVPRNAEVHIGDENVGKDR